HADAMTRLYSGMEKIDAEISAQQQAAGQAIAEQSRGEETLRRAKEASERPLVEKYPALFASLPFLGAVFAGNAAYVPRKQAREQYETIVQRMMEAVGKAETAQIAAPNAARTAQLTAQAQQYKAAFGDMLDQLNPNWATKVGAATAGGTLSAESSMLP